MEASVLGSPLLWIVSPRSAVAGALAGFIRVHLGQEIPSILPDAHILVLRHRESLNYQLDRESLHDLANSIVVVDLSSGGGPPSWDLDLADVNWLQPASLIARYPEVYWVFVVLAMPPLEAQILRHHFVDLHKLPDLIALIRRHAGGCRTLLDFSGFRRQIQQRGTGSRLATRRTRRGISLEDEVGYATLNGYFLYRRGCCTSVVTSTIEFLALRQHFPASTEDIFVIEDLELNYADLHNVAVDRAFRELLLPGPLPHDRIKEVLAERVDLYTSEKPKFRLLLSAQRIARESLPASGNCAVRSAVKPYWGFYDRTLVRSLRNAPEAKRGVRGFLVQHFGEIVAPFRKPTVQNEQHDDNHHSAPGRRQEIGAKLIARCKAHLDTVGSPEAAVHIAVLASEAERLLLHKTLHMSLEAVSLRHRAEVQAECMFMGTSNTLDVEERLSELQREVRDIVGHKTIDLTPKRWKRNLQYSNAMSVICGSLRDIYRRFDRREEEDKLLNAYRKWVRRAYYTNLASAVGSAWSNLVWDISVQARLTEISSAAVSLIGRLSQLAVSVVFWPVWTYLNLLTRGGLYLLSAALIWVTLYALWYHALFSSVPEIGERLRNYHITLGDCWKLSLSTFGGLATSLDGGLGGSWISDALESLEKQQNVPYLARKLKDLWTLHVSEMLLGFLHLGVFVTWLFQKFSRK